MTTTSATGGDIVFASNLHVAQVRIARPTDKLEELVAFYRDGLGLKEIGRFAEHAGYDGVMLGLPGKSYHLEFTRHVRGSPGAAPSRDNLLVLAALARGVSIGNGGVDWRWDQSRRDADARSAGAATRVSVPRARVLQFARLSRRRGISVMQHVGRGVRCVGFALLSMSATTTWLAAQQTVPFANGVPVAPAGFEPQPIPAAPIEYDTAEVMRIRVVPVARGLVNPWSLAFLPDGTLLVTEKDGRLRLIRGDVLDPKPVPGVPIVRVQGRSGLMDVVLHPQFATNRQLYFSYLKPVGEQSAVTVARGRFDGSAVTELRDIFTAGAGVSGPSRLAFGRDGKLYMTTPSSGDGASSQDPGSYAGKVLRLNDDGSVPADNPFVGRNGHKPEVFTLGHRNALGLAVHPTSGEMWQAEMGPNGGDELNVLKRGANYGWPLVSLGRTYTGPWQSPTFSKEGMESPVVYWTPAISVSGLAFYTGNKLPKWKGDVFVGGQRTGEIPGTGRLERVLVNDKLEELRRESLLLPLGMRIRDVRQGPDELLYVLVDHENGGVLRIEPSSTEQRPTNYSARPPR